MIRDQKTIAAFILLAFFFFASLAWKASWKTARLATPEVSVDKALNEGGFVVHHPKAPIHTVPAPKKEAAPAWGSFQVAGYSNSNAIPISLKQDLAPKPIPSPAAHMPVPADKKKKKETKTAAQTPKTPSYPEQKKVASGDDKMKALKDEAPAPQGAVIVSAPAVAPTDDASKPKTAKGKSEQEWENYLTENSSTVQARTKEFISALHGGQLDEGGTPTWLPSLIQRMFDNNSVTIQSEGLHIAKEAPGSQTFTVLVHNADRVDKTLQSQVVAAYTLYQDIRIVSFLRVSMFDIVYQVEKASIDILEVSLDTNLPKNAPPPAQKTTSNTDPRTVFGRFVDPLIRLSSDSKFPDIKGRAAALATEIQGRIAVPVNLTANTFQR